MPSVARLSVTPVKSLGLVHPDEASLEASGARHDRLFYLVDGGGELVNQTDVPGLVRIRPSYDPERERLTLSFPDGEVVEGDAVARGAPVITSFYGRPVRGHQVTGPWEEPLSRFAGEPVRLVRCDRPGDGTDVHPVTLVSRESVDELARRGGRDGELDARRFRMLLELQGCEPHEEDTWDGRLVRAGEAILRVHGQVPRCVVTTRDPDTGTKDFGTLNVIARYRPRIAGKRGLPFGMYAEVERAGRVRVGDPVEPL